METIENVGTGNYYQDYFSLGDEGMPDSYPFPIYSGVLEPKHYKQIGSALWLFLWCISSTTKDVKRDGETWGIVLGNKPVKVNELEEAFGVTDKTVRSWIKTLESNGYIKVTRVPYGLVFTVRNSKKFASRSVENYRSGSEENYRSLDRDRKKTTDHTEENYRSNKDITEIHNAAVIITDPDEILKRAHEVEQYFCQKRGKGFNVSTADFDEIKQLVATSIPFDIVRDTIDKSFAEYKPRHARDEIRNMSYCIPRCYDEWMRRQVAPSITDPVPSGEVALGQTQPPQPRRSGSRNQRQLDALEQLLREEEQRDQNRTRETAETDKKPISGLSGARRLGAAP